MIDRVSISSLARIETEQGFALIRDRGHFRREGLTRFMPVGGGVEVPGDFDLSFLKDFGARFERPPKTEGGTADLRLSIANKVSRLPARNDLRARVALMMKGLDPELLSPFREIQEELVDEEGIVGSRADLEGTTCLFRKFKHKTRRHETGEGETLMFAAIYDVVLPPEAMQQIHTTIDAGSQSVRFFELDELADLSNPLIAQPITSFMVF
jgi:hypothetical protein